MQPVKRICVVSHYCVPHIGGIEITAIEQAKRFVRAGIATTLVTSRTQHEMSEENLEGVLVRRVQALNSLERHWGIPYPIFLPSMIGVLNKEVSSADVCLIHGVSFHSSILAAFMCRMKGIPYVVYQYTPFVDYRNWLLNSIESLNDRILGSFVIANATALLTVSRKTKQYVQSLTSRNVDVLYEAVDDEVFAPLDNYEQLRTKFSIPPEKFVVITTGRMVYKRSMETVIDVARLLKDEQHLLFLMVGSGPDLNRLKHELHVAGLSNCLIYGAVPHNLIPDFYRVADLFILTSRTGEGIPISILEAWSTSLPVIATRSGGHDDFILSGENGFLVDADAPNAVAELVMYCLHNRESVRKMGRRGRQSILENFTWHRHVGLMLSYLHSAAHRNQIANKN